MNRSSVPILVGLLLLAGCVNPSPVPSCDPFFGRTTIPPPATGAAAGRTADPYYQSPPGIAAPSLPPGNPAGVAAPNSTAPSGWVPPGARGTATAPPTANPSMPGMAPNLLAPRPSSTVPAGARPSPSVPVNRPPPSYPPPPSYQQPPPSTTPPNPAPSSGFSGRYGNAPAAGTDRYRGVSLQGSGIVGQKPAVRTLQPRGASVPETPVVELGDLPK